MRTFLLHLPHAFPSEAPLARPIQLYPAHFTELRRARGKPPKKLQRAHDRAITSRGAVP
jgi:hypothetical protein